MAFFYEIRSADNTVLKRDGGFPTQDAAKIAGREDAKKLRNMRQPDRPEVGASWWGRMPRKLHGSWIFRISGDPGNTHGLLQCGGNFRQRWCEDKSVGKEKVAPDMRLLGRS